MPVQLSTQVWPEAAAAALIPASLKPLLQRLQLRLARDASTPGFGQHGSRQLGSGLEFVQYRPYQAGDDPKRIDWKLYARTDRLYAREAERESPLTVWLLLDASASMQQADPERPAWTRIAAASVLAACVLDVALRQGDRFGLVALSDRGQTLQAESSGRRGRDLAERMLKDLHAEGRFPGQRQTQPLWQHLHAGPLVVLLSDGFDPECEALALRLAATGREVRFVQVLTASERDFALRDDVTFADPETGAEVAGDAASMRADFLARFASAQAQLRARLAGGGVALLRWVIDEPIEAVLVPLCLGAPR